MQTETPPPTEAAEDPAIAEAGDSAVQVDRPDASQLVDRTPEWARLTRSAMIWSVVVAGLWVFFNYQPVWHTDVWGHLKYGQEIVSRGGIPETEPFLPLAQGIPFRDTAWLSQVLTYELYSIAGVTSLRFIHALLLTIAAVALLIRFRSRTDSYAIPLIGLAISLAIVWKSLFIVRPQLAGWTCFVVIFSLLTARRWNRWNWVLIPGLFALWANLHGSFPVGLGLLGMLWLGRAIDVCWRTGKLSSLWRDQKASRLFVLTELAVVAALLNPYGVGIYPAIESISSNLNVRDLIEWDPITLRMTHGKGFAIATLLLLLVYRWSPRRVSFAEPLLLCGFGLAALWAVRMMVWWAPLAAWFLVLHGSALMNRWERRKAAQAESDEEQDDSPIRTGMNTVIVIGICWIAFAITPFGATVLHGYPQDNEEFAKLFKNNVSSDTPVDLTRYLAAHPPEGLVFNTYEWGDYLLWAGPEDLQVYTNSHAHLLPREIWNDYFTISRMASGWDDKLARYGVNTVVIDKKYHERFLEGMKRDPEWKLDYEDPLGAIFLRRHPIPNQIRLAGEGGGNE